MPVREDFVRCNVGGLFLQRFHLFDGILSYISPSMVSYPKGLTAKRMVF